MKAFTYIELVIVLAVLVIIASVTMPTTFRFFKMQQLENTTENIVASLRQAKTLATTQKNDSSFGVAFSSETITLFQGTTFNLRDDEYDMVWSVPSSIIISGVSEVVFLKGTGTPSWFGTMLVQYGSSEQTISLNQLGLIERL